MAHDSPTALKVQQLQQYTSFAFKAAKVAKWKIIKTIPIPSEEQNNTKVTNKRFLIFKERPSRQKWLNAIFDQYFRIYYFDKDQS